MAFQTLLDSGFCKAKPHASAVAWFKRVAALPAFVKVCGHVKCCEKALKPLLAVEEKKAKAAPVQAKKAEEEVKVEKKKEWHELLPECDFDLYNYKTYLINVPDRKGEGFAETKKMFQSPGFNDGYSWWHIKYDKYDDEGQVQYKFSNLMGGFMQRCDPKMSRWAFGRMLMLGDEPDLEIEGIWMYRGQVIPEIMNDNPQFEYFHTKKLDFMNNAEDYDLIGQFFGAPKTEG